MAKEITLTVEVREGTGKGAARRARAEGKVPGVLYGGDLGPVAINLDGIEILKALNSGKFLYLPESQFDKDSDGKKYYIEFGR